MKLKAKTVRKIAAPGMTGIHHAVVMNSRLLDAGYGAGMPTPG